MGVFWESYTKAPKIEVLAGLLCVVGLLGTGAACVVCSGPGVEAMFK